MNRLVWEYPVEGTGYVVTLSASGTILADPTLAPAGAAYLSPSSISARVAGAGCVIYRWHFEDQVITATVQVAVRRRTPYKRAWEVGEEFLVAPLINVERRAVKRGPRPLVWHREGEGLDGDAEKVHQIQRKLQRLIRT